MTVIASILWSIYLYHLMNIKYPLAVASEKLKGVLLTRGPQQNFLLFFF